MKRKEHEFDLLIGAGIVVVLITMLYIIGWFIDVSAYKACSARGGHTEVTESDQTVCVVTQ